MTYAAIVLIALVWAVVGLAVAVWRVRRRVILLDDMATRTAHNLISAEANLKLDIREVQDSRSRTADLDVPVLHQPIPPNFHRNR